MVLKGSIPEEEPLTFRGLGFGPGSGDHHLAFCGGSAQWKRRAAGYLSHDS
jgi:hypothetical protein